MCTQSTAPIAIVAIVIRGNWQQRKQTPLKPIVAHFYNCTQRNRNFYLKSFRCFRERNGIKISSKMKTEKQLKSLRNGLKKTAMANCIRCVFAWRKRKYSHTRDCGDDYAHFIVPAQKTARNCCCRIFSSSFFLIRIVDFAVLPLLVCIGLNWVNLVMRYRWCTSLFLFRYIRRLCIHNQAQSVKF